jgi:hypothetical protein
MLNDLKNLIRRSDGLGGDILGAVSLMVILMAGMHLMALL